MTKEYTQKEVRAVLRALGPKATDEIKKSTVCALVGHSRITTAFLGYHHCARCSEQIGDSLGGAYTGEGNVVVGHNCDLCRYNYAKLNWRDKFMSPDPFAVEK